MPALEMMNTARSNKHKGIRDHNQGCSDAPDGRGVERNSPDEDPSSSGNYDGTRIRRYNSVGRKPARLTRSVGANACFALMERSKVDAGHDTARRYRMTIAYDGTNYVGWQIQPNGMTIQEKIEQAIHALTGQKATIHGSGRTDQGVHARRQVAHFNLNTNMSVTSLRRALNSLLPPDIRIIKVEGACQEFHARKDVKIKEYRYFIWNGEVMPPDIRNHRLHVRNKLDVDAMRKAAGYLRGRQDFASFAANPRRDIGSTVRDLDLKILKRGAEIVIVAKSAGFLYRMVRSLAGFLVRVGEGAIPPEEARAILSSKERTARVPTAAAHGLFLWNVTY